MALRATRATCCLCARSRSGAKHVDRARKRASKTRAQKKNPNFPNHRPTNNLTNPHPDTRPRLRAQTRPRAQLQKAFHVSIRSIHPVAQASRL
jgi:hypothetical protein